MTIPNFQVIMEPLLRFTAQKAEVSLDEAEEAMAAHFNLTEEERAARLPSGSGRVLRNRINWAKSDLRRGGYLDFPKRGSFRITEKGKALLANPPAQIDRKFIEAQLTPEDASYTQPREAGMEEQLQTPEEIIDAAFMQMQNALKEELRARILQARPDFFERLIVALMIAMGYGGSRLEAGQQLGRTGDGGIDGIINEDTLGLESIYLQAKRYEPGNNIGRPALQSFVGSLSGLGARKGVFVTTSTFSAQAIDYADRLTSHKIILIDGKKLTELMIKHGVAVHPHRAIILNRLDENFFTEE